MKQLKLIEPDIYELNTKINELKHFFLLTRSFSVKIVSNLIESEDFIQLTEEKLNLPSQILIEAQSQQINQDSTQTKIIQNKKDNRLVEVLVSTFQQQTENLWKHIERGEQNTQFIKDLISKNCSNQNFCGQSVNHQNQILGQTLQNFQMPLNQSEHNYIEPIPLRSEINFQQKKRKKDSMNSRSFSKLRFTELEHDKESSTSLQRKVGQMNQKIKKLRAQRKNDEKGLNEMIKKLVEIKAENEDALQQKDEQIKSLKKQLSNLKSKYQDVLKEKKSISKQLKKTQKQRIGIFEEQDHLNMNKILKENENLKKLLEKENRKNGKASKKTDNYYSQKLKKTEQEVLLLKEQLQEYSEKNIQLCKLFQEQNTLSVKTNGDSSIGKQLNEDLLKCLFIQSQQIEEVCELEIDENLSIHDE